jgi:colanic acid/amylovoran biosynthesis protein
MGAGDRLWLAGLVVAARGHQQSNGERSMKILIINLHSSHNAGDHVLLQVGLQQLYAEFPGCQITLAMNDPASYLHRPDAGPETVVDSFFAWFKTKSAKGLARQLGALGSLLISLLVALLYRLVRVDATWLLPQSRRATVHAYLAADLIVSCAGNFLYSRGHSAGLPLLGPVFTIAYGWLAGKPIVTLPQTIGPLWRPWERWLVRWLIGRMRLVLLRDPTSVALLQRMGISPAHYGLTPDIAFLYEGADAATGRALLHRYGIEVETQRPLLGVTLLNWGEQHPRFQGQAQYEAAVAAAIRHFVTTYNGRAVIFPQVCGPTPADDDRIPARRVRSLLAQTELADRVTVVDEEVPPATLKAAYGCMDLFLGSRLHSNIFTLTAGVPVIAIAYQDKTFGVMRMLGLDGWVIDIQQVDTTGLVTRLDQLWAQRAAVQRQISQQLLPLQTQARQAVRQLRTALHAHGTTS